MGKVHWVKKRACPECKGRLNVQQKICHFCGERVFGMTIQQPERKIFLEEAFEAGKTQAWCARKLGISRERVRQLVHEYFEIDYKTYRERVREEKKRDKLASRVKYCKQCGKEFLTRVKGGRYKYCSPDCYKEVRKEIARKWYKNYYYSGKGMKYQRRYFVKKKIFGRLDKAL